LATTTIFDIKKISELSEIVSLSNSDSFVINDRDPATNLNESKRVGLPAVIKEVASQTNLQDLKNVSTAVPQAHQILTYNGNEWRPADPDDSFATLDSFNVVNETTPDRGGRLVYDYRSGIFRFYPANINGPLSDASDVVAGSPADGEVLKWDGTGKTWYPGNPIGFKVVNAPATATTRIEIQGRNLVYYPPYISSFLEIPSGVRDGDVLVYNSTSGKWIPKEYLDEITPVIAASVDINGNSVREISRNGYLVVVRRHSNGVVKVTFNQTIPVSKAIVNVSVRSSNGTHFGGVKSLTARELLIFTRSIESNGSTELDNAPLDFTVNF
jgi:hypothetical protein